MTGLFARFNHGEEIEVPYKISKRWFREREKKKEFKIINPLS